MRTRWTALAGLPAVVLLGSGLAACGADGSTGDAGSSGLSGPTSSPSSPPSTSPSTSPSSGAGSGSDSGETACDEVRAGIDAFNQGDYAGTVTHFEAAVPLAQAEDQQKQTSASSDLLAAVQYYAALPAEDYLSASASSSEFAKYKAITLGQCETGGSDGGGGTGGGGVSV